jgi:hypothetical protein
LQEGFGRIGGEIATFQVDQEIFLLDTDRLELN